MKYLFPVFAACLLAACNKDSIPPVVELAGRNPDTIYARTQDAYPDPGATATDDKDGQVDVTVSGEVNMSVPGQYVLTYGAQDDHNNFSVPVERHVQVISADGAYTAFESCSSSGANNFTVNASSNAALDTVTLTDFPITGYVAQAVVKTGGYRVFQQTVSPVMSLEGDIACDGSVMNVTYTRTSLQGTGASESCTVRLQR